MDSGIILLNKKCGITSFDALRDIKRALGTGKVGHTGTLDKFAQGLLIVLAGRALKLSRWFSHSDKKYRGKIHFGIETDTLDPEGNIIFNADLPQQNEVEKALNQYTGDILQEPPAFSAIHVNGRRASDLARIGKIPEMKKRPVSIYKLELLSWQPPFAEIFVHCSSGTYIRSLARDIALAAGSRAHLCELIRTHVAGFECGMWNNKCDMENDKYYPYPIDKSVIKALGMPWFDVTSQETQMIIHGKPLEAILNDKSILNSLSETIALFSNEELIAVIEKINGKWIYGCVM